MESGNRLLVFIAGIGFMIAGIYLFGSIYDNIASLPQGMGQDWNQLIFPFIPFIFGLIMIVAAFANWGS